MAERARRRWRPRSQHKAKSLERQRHLRCDSLSGSEKALPWEIPEWGPPGLSGKSAVAPGGSVVILPWGGRGAFSFSN